MKTTKCLIPLEFCTVIILASANSNAASECPGGFSAGNYLTTGSTTLLSDLPQGTVEFCVYVNQHAVLPSHLRNSCVGKRNAGNPFPPLTFDVDADGRVFANWWPNPEPFVSHNLWSNTPIPAQAWTHVALTWDGVSWRMYVNGRQDGILADSSGLRVASDEVWLGADPWRSELYLDGRLDNVRISNVARLPGTFGTAMDVHTLAVWRLDGSGHDETGSNDLQQVGTITYSQSCDCQLHCINPNEPGVCVPALSEWGLLAMGLLTVAAGMVVVMRRRRVAA